MKYERNAWILFEPYDENSELSEDFMNKTREFLAEHGFKLRAFMSDDTPKEFIEKVNGIVKKHCSGKCKKES